MIFQNHKCRSALLLFFYNKYRPFLYSMPRKHLIISLLALGFLSANAQVTNSFVHQGEIGIYTGVGHYYGDLNSNANINRPKLAAGFFFRKQLGRRALLS